MQSPSPELGNRIIRAGAGAGKTYTLVSTLIDFIRDFKQRHGREPRVIVTTFTRKATQEVSERLVRHALQAQDQETFEYLQKKSKIHISTIHGVLSVLLSRHADKIGWPLDFKIEGGSRLGRLQKKIAKKVLNDHPTFMDLLKTHSFVELVSLAMQFRQMKGEQEQALALSGEDLRKHAYEAAHVFVQSGRQIGVEILASEPSPSWREWGEILVQLPQVPQKDDEWEEFFQAIDVFQGGPRKASAKGGKGKTSTISEDLANRYSEFIESHWRQWSEPENRGTLEPTFWKNHSLLMKEFENFAQLWMEQYDKALQSHGWIPMGDLEALGLRLIREAPEAVSSFSKEWDYWMVDEYQDTSPIQVRLLKALILDRPQFIVGDPQQSIYFFRGARSAVFEEKLRAFQLAGSYVQTMEMNRRSQPPVLAFINDFFKNRNEFHAMTIFEEKRKENAPEITVSVRAPLRQIGNEAVAAVIQRIQELLSMGESPEHIVVLARKNNVLKDIQDQARQMGIPVQLHSAGGFSGRREIRDVFAFLRFLANPFDDINLLTLLRTPWFHLSDAQIFKFAQKRRSSLWLAFKMSTDPDVVKRAKKLEGFRAEAERSGYAGAMKDFYQSSGLIDSATWMDASGRREANLWKLYQQLQLAQKEVGFNLLQFLNGSNVALSTDDSSDDADAAPVVEPRRVQLMTVHASKGLEFRHVIVAHMHDNRQSERLRGFMFDERSHKWTLVGRDNEGKLIGNFLCDEILAEREKQLAAESDRLFYVAITRAVQTVSLVWEREEKSRNQSRSWIPQQPILLAEGRHQGPGYVADVQLEITSNLLPLKSSKRNDLVLPPRWQWSEEGALIRTSPTELLQTPVNMSTRALSGASVVKGLQKAQWGTEAHRLFESLRYLSVESVVAMSNEQQQKKAVEWVAQQKNPPLLELIRNGFVEWGFTFLENGQMISGQIDLWCKYDGAIWIIDYKTGSLEYLEKAFDQMKIYAHALKMTKQISEDEQIHLLAVFPHQERIEEFLLR